MEVNITPRIINSLSLQFCNIIESIAVLWRRNIRATQLVSPRRLSEKVPPTRNQLPVQIYPNNQNNWFATLYRFATSEKDLIPVYGEWIRNFISNWWTTSSPQAEQLFSQTLQIETILKYWKQSVSSIRSVQTARTLFQIESPHRLPKNPRRKICMEFWKKWYAHEFFLHLSQPRGEL